MTNRTASSARSARFTWFILGGFSLAVIFLFTQGTADQRTGKAEVVSAGTKTAEVRTAPRKPVAQRDHFSPAPETARLETLALEMTAAPTRADQARATLKEMARHGSTREGQGEALRLLLAHELAWSEEMQGLVSGYLGTTATAAERLMVAQAIPMGLTEPKEFVLDQLALAYAAEPVVEVKRFILSQIVRAGGDAALPRLLALPADDPKLARDIADYQILFQAGYRDRHEIESKKGEWNVARDGDPGQPAQADHSH